MKRITKSELQAVVDRINRATGNPLEPYRREGDRNVSNIGNYHLSGAYGGYSLHQMANPSGGVRDVLYCGHVPARDLYNRMLSYLSGIQTQKDAA